MAKDVLQGFASGSPLQIGPITFQGSRPKTISLSATTFIRKQFLSSPVQKQSLIQLVQVAPQSIGQEQPCIIERRRHTGLGQQAMAPIDQSSQTGPTLLSAHPCDAILRASSA